MPAQHFGVGTEQRLPELVHDAGAAELGERIRGRARRDDRTGGELVARPMVIRDDHVEPEADRLAHLRRRGDAAVDRDHEPAPFARKACQRLPVDAVALVEARRQMPLDVRSRLAQHEHRQRGRADSVRVVVAVHADPSSVGDRGADALDRRGHVAEQERIVQRLFAGQKGPSFVGVAVSAPDEHAGRDLADAEPLSEGARLPVRARTDRPAALLHRAFTVGRASDGTRPRCIGLLVA